jgi:hypothetical protein
MTRGTAGGATTAAGPAANQVTVTLTGVPTAQHMTVNLTNVGVTGGSTLNNLSANMDVLVGDVDVSRRVDSTDVFKVRQQSLQTTNSSNFRTDIDASGRIDSTDVFITRQNSLTALPAQ